MSPNFHVVFLTRKLSADLDAILFLVYDALDRSQKCKAYRKYFEEVSNSSSARSGTTGDLLRAVLPILHVHSETTEVALAHATSESFGINRILNELEECANDLRKFAEQNHTLADQLDCYSCMAPGQSNVLSNEKRAIAEIEDAVVERIEELTLLALRSTRETVQNEETSASIENEGSSLTAMSDLCEVLFLKQQTETSLSSILPPRSVGNGNFTESQMFAAEALQKMHSNSR
jgi:hypothetical protein